jgi:hypothetical protein
MITVSTWRCSDTAARFGSRSATLASPVAFVVVQIVAYLALCNLAAAQYQQPWISTQSINSAATSDVNPAMDRPAFSSPSLSDPALSFLAEAGSAGGSRLEPSHADAMGYWFQEPAALEMPTVQERKGWLFGDSIVGTGEVAGTGYWWQVMGRGHYLNDQRWEFTGQEATFGVEGILVGGFVHHHAGWTLGLGGEFYVNQPFDANILVDAPVREAYKPNFILEPFEISQLALSASRGDITWTLGKITTPFGRTYFPLVSNARWDAPFIRSEAILWRETGWMMDWTPDNWELTVALTNGSEDQDTNSSKALISRIGWSGGGWTLGGSIKEQDGIGSEGQKYYNSHVGLDVACRIGRWTICSEMIYDKYGFRRDSFSPDEIDWGRSLYHRDLHYQDLKPITGWGYYVGGLYEGEKWMNWLSYGQYLPQELGDPIHDHETHRFLGKFIRHLTPSFDAFAVVLLENSIEVGQDGYPRHGVAVNAGFQASF